MPDSLTMLFGALTAAVAWYTSHKQTLVKLFRDGDKLLSAATNKRLDDALATIAALQGDIAELRATAATVRVPAPDPAPAPAPFYVAYPTSSDYAASPPDPKPREHTP